VDVSSLARHAAQEPRKVRSLRDLGSETFKSILDSVGVALAVIDHEGRCVFTNQTALNMFGVTENLSFTEWRRAHKVQDSQGREIPAEQAPLLRALAGEEVEPCDVRVTLPDGRIKWLHSAAFPFSVLGLSGVLAVCADETEQVELRRAMEQAQRMAAFGVLAGGLVHDFNNILSVLSGNIALAQNDEDVQQIRARLQQMAVALDKGAALVARLMQYSHKEGTQLRPVQINEAVNAVLELTRPLLKDQVRVKTKLSRRLPAVQAYSSQLEQMLLNLILNALDAMPEGGELTLSTGLVAGDAVSEGKNEKKNQFVLITVADTGIGIAEHLRVRMFDPFFTTKPGGKGVGLGLSSARSIVRQHNGHIKVHSTPGAGTKFSIYLPVQR